MVEWFDICRKYCLREMLLVDMKVRGFCKSPICEIARVCTLPVCRLEGQDT